MLAARIEAREIFDIAAIPALNGGSEPLRTCRAHGAARVTRRDYWFVHRSIMRWVRSVSLEGV
eukprot:15482973-Alexandrium_andersonii.AAC.1